MLLRMSATEPVPLTEIEPDPDASPAQALAILEALQAAGLVQGDAESGFRLAFSAREITVSRVVDALSPDLYHVNPRREDRVALVLEPLFYRLDAERRALLNATLADLRRR